MSKMFDKLKTNASDDSDKPSRWQTLAGGLADPLQGLAVPPPRGNGTQVPPPAMTAPLDPDLTGPRPVAWRNPLYGPR